MKRNYRQIKTQEELDEILKNNSESTRDFFVLLNGGLRSSKEIELNAKGDYSVYNEISDTEETIKHDEFMHTFIGEAIKAGAFYKY